MAKYNFHSIEKDDNLGWAIVHAVSQLSEKDFKKLDPKSIEIQLTVEGIGIDFLEFVQHYFSQLDRLAEDRAKEILDTHFSEVGDILYEIEEFLKDKLSTVEENKCN